MPAKTAAPAPAAKKAPAAAPATKPAAAAKPAAAPKAAAASTTGIYISPIDLRNQSAEEVRDRFTVYGPVSQLRVKRNKKVKAPYALVWFKSAEDAKKAVAEIKTTEPEGTTVEFIKAAKPVEARTTTASTIHINPINVPTRSSKGYGKLAKKIRDLFPESVKTRLHREDDGTGSALVYFKDNSAASAAKAKLNGKLFDRPVVVKPCCRTLVKDQKRFVAPLKDHADLKAALALKVVETKKAEEAKVALAAQNKELARIAAKKAVEDKKAQAAQALSNAQVKHIKETKPLIVTKGAAPAKTPLAKTPARQPIQSTKTVARKG